MLKTYDMWENVALSKRVGELGEAEGVRLFWFAQVTTLYLLHLDVKMNPNVAEPRSSWRHLIATDVQDALSLLGSEEVQEARITLQARMAAGKGYICSGVVNIKEAYNTQDKQVFICQCENARSYILDPELSDEAQLARKKQIWP